MATHEESSAAQSVLRDENLLARLDRAPMTRTIWIIVVLIMLSWVMEGFDIGIIGPIILLVDKPWHLTPHEIGLLGGAGTFGIVLGLLPAGLISDHYGRRNTLIVGIATFAFFTLVSGASSGFVELILFRFFAGVGEGAVFSIPYLLLTELVNKKSRGVAVGWAQILLGVAYTLTSLGALWVNRSFSPEIGWRILCVIGGAPLLTIPVLWTWLPESPRFLLKRGRSDMVRAFVERIEDEAGLAHDTTIIDKTSLRVLEATRDHQIGLRTLLQPEYLKRCFISYSALGSVFVGFYLAIIFAPKILNDMGMSKSNTFLIVAILFLVSSLCQPINGYACDRFGRRRTLVICMFVNAISLFMLGQKSLPISVLVVFGVAVFALQSSFTGAKVYMAEQFPTMLRGTGVTIGECITRFLAGVVLVYYIPSMADTFGLSAVFTICATLTTLLILPLLFFGMETAGRSVEETGGG